MAELGEANIGGRMVPAWLLNLTAEELDSLKSRWYSNPNLMDNWYFGNPVNQRGQTEYAVQGYTIDRWRSGSASDVVKVENGALHISMTVLYQPVFQSIESPEQYSGKTLTASVLVEGVDASNSYQLVVRTGTAHGQYKATVIKGAGLHSATWKVPDGATLLQVAVQSIKENAGSISIKAVKLELGSQQTLAHQDADGNWILNEIPDYGEQLRRCQRYFQTFATQSLRPTDALDFRPVMRTTPALSTITVGTKTLYAASADL